jgi:hypothetical protein
MSAEAQTNSSTEVGSEPPAVGKVNGNNAGKKTVNGPNGKPATETNTGKKTVNGPNGKSAPTETVAAPAQGNSGKNPVLEKISSSLTELTSSLEKGNCGDVVSKVKTVIQNADPVLEAIGKQQLRENNSQLAEVKGKVRSATNSIRQKCPKGMNGSRTPTTNTTRTNNSGGIPVKKKEAVQTEVKVGQIWNVITSWAKGNERSGYDALVKITKVDDKSVSFEATKIKQTSQINGMEEGEERTYSMEEWKALRKVLEEDAQANTSKNNTNAGPVELPAVGTKWKITRSEPQFEPPHGTYYIDVTYQVEITSVEGQTITAKRLNVAKGESREQETMTFTAKEWKALKKVLEEDVKANGNEANPHFVEYMKSVHGGRRPRKTRKQKRKATRKSRSRRRRM